MVSSTLNVPHIGPERKALQSYPVPMASFGITQLGYQNPIGDKVIVKPTTSSEPQDDGINPSSLSKQFGSLRCTDICVYNQPVPYSSDIPCGSQEKYRGTVKPVKMPRSQNELSLMPPMESQQYGWLTSKEKTPDPRTQVKRFPRKNSEMTNFVKQMSMTDPGFSLF